MKGILVGYGNLIRDDAFRIAGIAEDLGAHAKHAVQAIKDYADEKEQKENQGDRKQDWEPDERRKDRGENHCSNKEIHSMFNTLKD